MGFLTKSVIALDTVFMINGVYDILCAISILGIVPFPILDELHLSVLKKNKKEDPLMERFLAYWLFTYGLIRIFGDRRLIAYSYFTEATFFANEWRMQYEYKSSTPSASLTVFFTNYSMDISSFKSVFVIVSSILLGGLALST